VRLFPAVLVMARDLLKTLLKLIVSIKNTACCANCALFKPIAPTIPDRPAKRYCGHRLRNG
jgi:hypothetical protein